MPARVDSAKELSSIGRIGVNENEAELTVMAGGADQEGKSNN